MLRQCLSEGVALQRKAAAERKAAREIEQQFRKNERKTRRHQQTLEKLNIRRRAERRYEWVRSKLNTDPVDDARQLIAGRGRNPAPATDHFVFVVSLGFFVAACDCMKLDRGAALRQIAYVNGRTSDQEWLDAARARQLAVHLAHSLVGIEHSKIARAFNLNSNTVRTICLGIKARVMGDALMAGRVAGVTAAIMPPNKRKRHD